MTGAHPMKLRARSARRSARPGRAIHAHARASPRPRSASPATSTRRTRRARSARMGGGGSNLWRGRDRTPHRSQIFARAKSKVKSTPDRAGRNHGFPPILPRRRGAIIKRCGRVPHSWRRLCPIPRAARREGGGIKSLARPPRLDRSRCHAEIFFLLGDRRCVLSRPETAEIRQSQVRTVRTFREPVRTFGAARRGPAARA